MNIDQKVHFNKKHAKWNLSISNYKRDLIIITPLYKYLMAFLLEKIRFCHNLYAIKKWLYYAENEFNLILIAVLTMHVL